MKIFQITKIKTLPHGAELTVTAGFLIFLLLAILNLGDFGVGWDEPQQRIIGQMNYNYAFKGDTSLLEFKDRDHGAIFEMILIQLEKSLNLDEEREIYRMRHMAGHLFFLFGAYLFYLLLKKQFKAQLLAITGLGFLLLTPTIYGHSFTNSKDIPFMVLMIASQVTLISTDSRNKRSWAVHGIVTGVLLSVRLLGLLMVALSLLKIFYYFLQGRSWRNLLTEGSIFLLSCCAALYIFWPYLWSNPVDHLLFSFKSMAAFNWDDPVLFMGKQIPAPELPWYYLPVNMVITIPLVYSLFFLVGIIMLGGALIKHIRIKSTGSEDINDLIFVLLVLLPFLSIWILDSNVYDSWRHLFFIYPAFIYISLQGLNYLYNRISIKYIILIIVLIQVSVTTINMIKIHPYQYLHYNILADKSPERVRQNYEMDYWGTSYAEGFRYILKQDTSKSIKVMVANNPGLFNAMLLKKDELQRMDIRLYHEKPDYFLSNYRFHPEDYPYGSPWYSVKRMNSSILSVWRMGLESAVSSRR